MNTKFEWKIQSDICKGLSEVCSKLAKSTKDKNYQKKFKKNERVFKAFSDLYKSNQYLSVIKKQEEKKQKEKKEIINKLDKLIKNGIMSKKEVIKCLKKK